MPRTLLLLLIALPAHPAAAARPYRPAADDQVLLRLPAKLIAEGGELADLRRQLLQTPDNLPLATRVAARYVSLGKQQGDPRYYGYARAALRPWWDDPSPPTEALRLRAKITERDHRYRQALADLRLLLRKAPRDTQAWIELANIHRVLGEYDQAHEACERLASFADPASVLFCRAPLQAVTGHAAEAYDSLARILPVARRQWPDAVGWVLVMQADVARTLGRDADAERHYLAGLEHSPADAYLLRAYSDWLLERGRAAEALALVQDHLTDTGLLLRAALAADQLGDSARAREWAEQLEQRFAEVRLRGGAPHGRYESRFVLQLRDDPPRALAIAQENWERQKEWQDTRNLLAAALAARDAAAAGPAIALLRQHQTEDAQLRRLVEAIEDLP